MTGNKMQSCMSVPSRTEREMKQQQQQQRQRQQQEHTKVDRCDSKRIDAKHYVEVTLWKLKEIASSIEVYSNEVLTNSKPDDFNSNNNNVRIP